MVGTLAVLEEVEEDDFVELETFALVNGQTEHVAHEGWDLGLALLIAHDNDSVTTKLLLLHFFLLLLCLIH